MAARHCREQGVQKMSLRGVAKEIGISAPSLYEYFKNKDALIDTLRDLERTRLALPTNRASMDSDSEVGPPYLPLVNTCKEAIKSKEVAPYIREPAIGRAAIRIVRQRLNTPDLVGDICLNRTACGSFVLSTE